MQDFSGPVNRRRAGRAQGNGAPTVAGCTGCTGCIQPRLTAGARRHPDRTSPGGGRRDLFADGGCVDADPTTLLGPELLWPWRALGRGADLQGDQSLTRGHSGDEAARCELLERARRADRASALFRVCRITQQPSAIVVTVQAANHSDSHQRGSGRRCASVAARETATDRPQHRNNAAQTTARRLLCSPASRCTSRFPMAPPDDASNSRADVRRARPGHWRRGCLEGECSAGRVPRTG